MAVFLVTYRPICATKLGRTAIESYGIPPFVDASCRREPDFESRFPAITALCRSKLFAPRLRLDDMVVYVTKKGQYERVKPNHWRLSAVLRVLHRFGTHHEAADWYRDHSLPIPANCMVEGNPPIDLEHTGGPKPRGKFGDLTDAARVIRRWDAGYRARAKGCGVVLVTEPVFLNLHHPVPLFDRDLGIFGGRMPGTQNPPSIDPEIVDRLLDHAGRHRAA